MFNNTHNELIKCIRARTPALNLVLDSERHLDKGFRYMLCRYGDAIVDDAGVVSATGSPVGLLNYQIIPGLECGHLKDQTNLLKPDQLDILQSFVKSMQNRKPQDMIMGLRDVTVVPTVMVMRDLVIKDNLPLIRALLMHCSMDVPNTVIVVTSEPIQEPRLRAYMPVITMEHPSAQEIEVTVRHSLQGLAASVFGDIGKDPNGDRPSVEIEDKGKVDTVTMPEAARICSRALVGLHMNLALNLLMTQLEVGLRHPQRNRQCLRVCVADLYNDKAAILNKEGYMSLIRDLPTEDRIGGLTELKHWIHKRRKGFTEHARASKLATPKGMLLVGPPGTAKSLSAKVTAGMFGVPLIRLDVGALFQGVLGSSERNIRNALAVADASSPCVLWLDEVG